jgi:thioredoxin 1
MIKYLGSAEAFEKEVSIGTVLVDFYADWCGPCKMMGEILEGMEDVNVLKVNVDDYPDIAQNFGIISIPTLILFKEGSETDKLIGLQSKSDIEEFLK